MVGSLPVHDPRAIVVGSESEGNVITRNATVHDVALHWVVVVVGIASGATDDVKGVSVQMDRVLETFMIQIWSERFQVRICYSQTYR